MRDGPARRMDADPSARRPAVASPMLAMQSDWYRTKKAGVYLVVPAGDRLDRVPIPGLADLIDDDALDLAFENCDSRAASRAVNVLGVEDCLKLRGYCLVRT